MDACHCFYSYRYSTPHDCLSSNPMKHFAYLGYSLGWKLVRLLPETSAYRIAYFAADYLTKKNGKGVQRLRKNYARIRPELSVAQLEELVQLGMRS
ncbi:MAG: hypothetical protein F2573_05960, partial [Actinobacteria bacterium]|nr:hypothetical protein [Actinomycetota bacterium]